MGACFASFEPIPCIIHLAKTLKRVHISLRFSRVTQQDTRLAPAYFPPTSLFKDEFWNNGSIFLKKKHCFFVKFSNVSKFKTFMNCLQKFKIAVEKTFHEKKIFWYAFDSKFATLTDFGKKTGFFKNTFSSKKTETFPAVLSKVHSTCSDLFEEIYIFMKEKQFYKYFRTSRKKNLQQDCQNCILRVQTNILDFSKKNSKH